MENLEALKAHPKILSIYRDRVQLKSENGAWVGKCPFHGEKTGSFVVNKKDGKWLYKCFGCDAGGSILDFVQKVDSCSLGDAVKKVRFAVGDWQSDKTRVEETFKSVTEEKGSFSIPLETYGVMTRALIESLEAGKYLISRGISKETAIRCSVGYRRTLPGRTEEGWLCIPTFTRANVTGLKYRATTTKDFSSQKGGINGLFNSPRIDSLSPVFVTEGEMDALSFEEVGHRAVSIGAAQTKLTPEEKDKLLEADVVYLAGDNDPPGQEAMQRLWADLQERTYLLQWPPGVKDANELLMKLGKEKFKTEVLKLMAAARSTPMPHITSLQESLANSSYTKLADHPNRLRFPWPAVDKMAILLPGSVMAISATNTKMGKTNFVKDITLYNAFRGDVVLNYSAELNADEFGTMVAAGILKKNRNHLSEEDRKEAAGYLTGVKYYIGRNAALVTVEPVLDLIEAGIRRLGATIAVIDHIDFICRNSPNEVKSKADAMQRIKNLAVKYGVKFIVVNQPRKANQATKGKAIHITDFKGSETATSDADAIFMIHRADIKIVDPDNPPMDDYDPKMEVRLLGARAKGDGATYAELTFNGAYGIIVEPLKEKASF